MSERDIYLKFHNNCQEPHWRLHSPVCPAGWIFFGGLEEVRRRVSEELWNMIKPPTPPLTNKLNKDKQGG